MTFLKFRNFINESSNFSFEDVIDIYGKTKNLSLYNEPAAFKNVSSGEGKIYFDLRPIFKRSGIEDMIPEKVKIFLEVEIENDDESTTLKEINWEPSNIEVELKSFPLYITGVEIDMKKSEDPKKWVLSLYFGGGND